MPSRRHADNDGTRVPLWRRPRARIWSLIAVVDALAFGLWTSVIRHMHLRPHGSPIPWVVLAVVVTICESVPVHLEVRGEAHSVTLTEIPLVVGLLLGTPGGLVLSQVLGVNVARMCFRRQSGIKHAFNAGVSALDVTLSVV